MLPHALLVIRSEQHRPPVLQIDPVRLVLAHEVERIVVEDVAVLEDLQECRALVMRRGSQRFLQMRQVHVDRSRDEGRFRTDRQRQRIERPVQRPHRRRLRHLAELRRRRVLALRQTVDPVVE